MNLKRILCLVMPVLCYGQLSVKIRASDDEELASVSSFGSETKVVDDHDIETFHLTDKVLKDACGKRYGQIPYSVFVRDPVVTKNAETSYKGNNFDQIKKTVKAVETKIIGINHKPVIVTTQEFINESKRNVTYNAEITQSVESSATTSWSTGHEISVGTEVSFSVGFASGGVSMGYTGSWGKEESETQTTSVGSSSGVSLTLGPNESSIAKLTATQGTMEVRVVYSATISGDVFALFYPPLNSHYYLGYPINYVHKTSGYPITYNATSNVKIGFYSHVKIKVY